MTASNKELRARALQSLKGRWDKAIVAFLILLFVTGVAQCVPFLAVLITIPVGYGVMIWFLEFYRGERGAEPDHKTIFSFFDDYIRIFFTIFLAGIYTALWSLLFIIPGIIKGLSYSMTTYILKDHPELQFNDAIELSMRMMKGNKMRLFLMYLNFMMWTTLSIFTLGIALLWVVPYMHTTLAAFYEDLRADFDYTIPETL